MNNTISLSYLDELNSEYRATRACLEKIPETLYEFKPHPKSMAMGYLVHLIAEIPLWIKHMVMDSEIDLGTFQHFAAKNTKELVSHFEDNMEAARIALKNTNDKEMQGEFSLKTNGQLIYSSPMLPAIGSTLNHWVHHRGQLTVYMRLNDIPVPSIYGPSADEKTFTGQQAEVK